MIRKFIRDERGVTLVEWCLIMVTVTVTVVSVIEAVGTQLLSGVTNLANQLGTVAAP